MSIHMDVALDHTCIQLTCVSKLKQKNLNNGKFVCYLLARV